MEKVGSWRFHSYKEYLNDIRTVSAVERQFEGLGEAARRISTEFQHAYPNIDWQRIIGLRNIIAHRYDEVRQEILKPSLVLTAFLTLMKDSP
ncbi:MAG: DUF86 domain-containing protein [Leptolyngbya sp. SIO1E4]|nr:DUF86 domain-containing protein [Leptolyngbya sp. SIO1E4]